MDAGSHPPDEPIVVLYQYGWIAWFWRALIAVALTASAFLLLGAVRFGSWWFVAMALPLAVPSLFFPWVLAVRIDQVAGEEIVVTNLFFLRRRIRRDALGRPRVKQTAQATVDHIAAPRAWIPVRGRSPIYVDLYANIPDPAAFRAFFKIPR